MDTNPNWLLTEIARGLQKLCLLSLDRSPAMDAIEGTALAWVEAIQHNRSWAQGRDQERIRAAFVTLAQTRQQWPAPKHFLEALPEPNQQKRLEGAGERPADPPWLREHIAKHQVDYQLRRAQGGEK